MLFPTIEFALFFPVVFLVSWLLRPSPTAWKRFVLVASFVFYGWWDVRYTLLLAGLIVGNHLFALAIDRTGTVAPGSVAPWPRKAWLAAAVAANLATLGWFKYYGFFVTSVTDGLRRLGIDWSPPLLDIVLPVGISFLTFQALTYVIDTFRGVVRPTRLLDFAVYLSFFPHLVAGPIVRAREFLPQLRQRPDPRRIDGSHAFRLAVAGLFKKVVVASFLASAIVDPVFAAPNQHTALELLVGVYAYAIQIYADFSGYTDIAIACALLLGIRFPANFDSPYVSRSVTEFWRRWHLTLSFFLRDYLYVPLGGNRGSRWRTYRNLFLVMAIGGLWHGAAWTFVAWGVIHGSVLVIERFGADRRAALGLAEPEPTPGRTVVRWLVTFHVVCLGWVFFRATTFTTAWEVLSGIATNWGPAPLVTPLVLLTIVAMLASQFVPEVRVRAVEAGFSRAPLLGQAAALAACFFVIDALGPDGVAPFIYFQF